MKTLKVICTLAIALTLQSHAANHPAAAKPAANPNTFLGYWVGWFKPDKEIVGISAGEHDAWNYENKITISIDRIEGNTVTGHSVVAGNNRPFAGTVSKNGALSEFVLKEPGDDKYDGVFKFTIDEKGTALTGTWKANNKINIPLRNYTLEKKAFKYDANAQLSPRNQYVNWAKNKKVSKNDPHYRADYDISYFTTSNDVFKYNASQQQLTKEQVANLKKADLFILRNSIYARHGYSFKNQQLRAYFDREEWYIPISTDIKIEFTAVEKKNIELLMRYETNAKEYYDVFGRG